MHQKICQNNSSKKIVKKFVKKKFVKKIRQEKFIKAKCLLFIVLEMYNFGEGKATGRLPSVKIEALVNRHLEMH